MATPWDLLNMSNEELIEAYDGSQTSAGKGWIRDELLRRLSAGNPQAEKVQISYDPRYKRHQCHDAECPFTDDPEPERSDGRIETPYGPMTMAEIEAEATRYGECGHPCERTDPHFCHFAEVEAQRSAGRIEDENKRLAESVVDASRIEAGRDQIAKANTDWAETGSELLQNVAGSGAYGDAVAQNESKIKP